jgi:hypothetical protein
MHVTYGGADCVVRKSFFNAIARFATIATSPRAKEMVVAVSRRIRRKKNVEKKGRGLQQS